LQVTNIYRKNDGAHYPNLRAEKTALERFSWRSTKQKMAPAEAVNRNKVEAVIPAARVAPTSSGIFGPYRPWLALGCVVAALLSRSCGRVAVPNG
jgi:hypothetical protein